MTKRPAKKAPRRAGKRATRGAKRKTARRPAPRRMPAQARSRERVERILDAAAGIFDDVGYEAATTDAIARRARTSIGSLYQFFPNKQALFEALAAKLREEVRAVFDTLATPEIATLPIAELADKFIDGYVAFLRETPGARAVLAVSPTTPELAAGTDALEREFEDRVALLVALRAPSIDAERRKLVSTVAVHVLSALMLVALREDGTPFADRIIDEARRLVVSYLEPLIEPQR